MTNRCDVYVMPLGSTPLQISDGEMIYATEYGVGTVEPIGTCEPTNWVNGPPTAEETAEWEAFQRGRSNPKSVSFSFVLPPGNQNC